MNVLILHSKIKTTPFIKFFSTSLCAQMTPAISNLNSLKYLKKSKRSILTISPECLASGSFLIPTRNFSYLETVSSIWRTISNSTPVAYVQQGLVELHDLTGLPWWCTIVISTILLRTVITLPLAIYQNKILARIELLTLEMPDIVKELKRETAIAIKKFQWTEQQARIMYNRSLRKQWNNLIVRDNCHPAKTMIVLWGQIPLWIFQSVAIRNLVYMLPDPNVFKAKIIFTELTLGGFLWMPNLTEIDSSYILPVALGLLNLSIIEIQSMTKTKEPGKLQKYATHFFRGLSIIMIPIAATVPSCLSLYWVTSSAYGLCQNLLLMSPKFKTLVGIPMTPSQLDRPYRHIVNKFSERIEKLLTFQYGLKSKK